MAELQRRNQVELAKKRENGTKQETYSRVLNNSNLVLPSLFKDNVAQWTMPEHEMLSTRTRLGGMRAKGDTAALSPDYSFRN